MYYDIHSHILPGFDDGSPDLETSLAMLKQAAESGTSGIVATPHYAEGEWQPEWAAVEAACKSLAEQAKAAQIPIAIYPGAEVAFYSGIEDMVEEPGRYCINATRYMLVELPANQIPLTVDDFFFTLEARGIQPVLAHPERYLQLLTEPRRLLEWIDRGVLLQVNGSSLLGKMGSHSMELAETLLMSNMIHCIASDGHGIHSRRVMLKEAAAKVEALVGAKTAAMLFKENPERMIHDQTITIPEPDAKRLLQTKGFIAKLLQKMSRR